MAYRITPDGIEDDERDSPQEIYEFIVSVSEDLGDLLKYLSGHPDFTLDDFQTILDGVYSYSKAKKGE